MSRGAAWDSARSQGSGSALKRPGLTMVSRSLDAPTPPWAECAFRKTFTPWMFSVSGPVAGTSILSCG